MLQILLLIRRLCLLLLFTELPNIAFYYIAALDGWTSGTHRSFWSFILLTPNRKEYLYRLSDLSDDAHTADYLTQKMDELITLIGPNKFAAIVSDNAANVKKARREISRQYPNIQNTRCIAHCINLIAGDIVEHKFADKLLRRVNILVSFFHNTSRAGNNKSLTFDF